MFKQSKKSKLETLFPVKSQSHKKRNTLIGLGSAAAAVVIAGATAKKSDSQ